MIRRRVLRPLLRSISSTTCSCDLPGWPNLAESVDLTSRLLPIAPYAHHICLSTPGKGSHDWGYDVGKTEMPTIMNLFQGRLLVNQCSDVVRSGKDDDNFIQDHGINNSIKDKEINDSIKDNGTGKMMVFPEGLVYPAFSKTGGTPLQEMQIFICGHASRDARCGAIGPVLKAHIEVILKDLNIPAKVWLSSHFGGHKFAGLVVFHLPPGQKEARKDWSSVWYGRVNLSNVRQIVQSTIIDGVVMDENCRLKTGRFMNA